MSFSFVRQDAEELKSKLKATSGGLNRTGLASLQQHHHRDSAGVGAGQENQHTGKERFVGCSDEHAVAHVDLLESRT
jgi:hypothetical protein